MEEKIKDSSMNLASPWVRIGAYLVDWLSVFIVMIPIAIPFGLFSAITAAYASSQDSTALQDFAASSAATTSSIILSLLSLALTVVSRVVVPAYVWNGQTLGKKLLNIKVTRVNGGNVVPMDMLKRFAIDAALMLLSMVPIIACLTCCAYPIVYIANLVLLFTDEKRQTLNDKVAETIVVNA